MINLTREERVGIAIRIEEIKTSMRKLELTDPSNIPEWAALYEQCDAIDRQLGDDG